MNNQLGDVQKHQWLFVLLLLLGGISVASITFWFLYHSQYYAWPVSLR
jgi:hypothetical protein